MLKDDFAREVSRLVDDQRKRRSFWRRVWHFIEKLGDNPAVPGLLSDQEIIAHKMEFQRRIKEMGSVGCG